MTCLDFRVSQVCKSYHLQHSVNRPTFCKDDDLRYVRKVLFSTNPVQSETNNFSVMAIGHGDEVYYLTSGDDQWSKLKDSSSKFGDIIMYKGSFYVVDQCGETAKFDSSFNETKVSSRIYDGGKDRKKRLVELNARLFLIDMIVDRTKPLDDDSWNNPLEIKMYRLDEEQEEWIEVDKLGDRIFFAGSNCCFSVSSQQFGDRYRGNCIYDENGCLFYDEDDSDEDMWFGGCCCRGFYSNRSDGPIVGGSGVNECDDGSNDNDNNERCREDVQKNEHDSYEDDNSENGRDSHGDLNELDSAYERLISNYCDRYSQHDVKNEHGRDHDDKKESGSDEDNKSECDNDTNEDTNYGRVNNDCGSDDDDVNGKTNGQCNDEDLKRGYSSNDDETEGPGSKSVLVLTYKGLYGNSPGVFTMEDGKFRSLSSFLEYADIFWPPLSCLNLEDQTPPVLK